MTRTAELTAKLLDGAVTVAEGVELDALVAADPCAESEHVMLLELEAELRGLRTGFDVTEATLSMIQELQGERLAEGVLSQIATAPPPPWAARHAEPSESQPPRANRRHGARFAFAGLAACAAAIAIGVWLGEPSPAVAPKADIPTTHTPAAFAKLSRKSGSVELVTPSGDAITAEEGGDLPAGFTLRTVGDDSHAVVEFLRDSTRVEIEPDSVVRFAGDGSDVVSHSRLFLASGQLTAAVPQRPDDRQVVVATGVAEVLARCGTFVVSSAGPDSARVDIKNGNVEVVRPVASKPVALGVGRAAFVFAGNDRLDIERVLRVDHRPKWTLPGVAARDAVFSPDGREVWVATARHLARRGEGGAANDVGFYPRRGGDGVAAFTRDKKFLVTFRGERDDRILVRSLPDGGEHAAINARLQDPRLWAAAPDASWVAVVDPKPNNRLIRLTDAETGEERFARGVDDACISCVAAEPDGKRLAVGVVSTTRGVGNKVQILDARTGERLFALPVPKRPVTAMAFSADGRQLAVGFNGTIQLWDVRSRELIRSITGFERVLQCLAFSPDGARLAAGTQDGHVWLWDTSAGRQTQLIDLGSRGVRALAFSPDGKQLVTVATNVPVAVWDVTDSLVFAPGLQ